MRIQAKDVFGVMLEKIDTPVADIEELIGEALEQLYEEPLSQIQQAELIEEFEGKVRAEINSHILESQRRKVLPDIEFGFYSSKIINNKANLRIASQEFFIWLKELDPRKFEFLCKKVLELLGCEQVNVTQPTKDGGVDFYGIRKIYDSNDVRFEVLKDKEVLVVGQAKHYTSPIGIAELRQFLGSSFLLKFTGLKNVPDCLTNPISDKKIKPLAPTLLVFITSSEATINTQKVANWLGIDFFGRKALLEIFYRNNFGFRRSPAQVQFDPKDFDEVLLKYE